jgi:hypothetical protein
MRSFRISDLGGKSLQAIESKLFIRIHVTALDLARPFLASPDAIRPDLGNVTGSFRLSKNDRLPATAGDEGKRHNSSFLTTPVLPNWTPTR